jgi:hypothetical protein
MSHVAHAVVPRKIGIYKIKHGVPEFPTLEQTQPGNCAWKANKIVPPSRAWRHSDRLPDLRCTEQT